MYSSLAQLLQSQTSIITQNQGFEVCFEGTTKKMDSDVS